MHPPRLARAAFGLVGLTAFLLVFGSTVRVHGAGLSCPDWPLCFGQVVPAYEFRVYLEFGHRVVAGFVSLGFLALWVASARAGRLALHPWLRPLFVVAALVLATQVVLGGLTVLELLAEWTVASHLVTGNTFCALLLVIALVQREIEVGPSEEEIGGGQRALASLISLLVPAQLALGGLVAGSHAGLACGTWPSCNGAGWFPTFAGLVGLQVQHRVVAYVLAGLVLLNVFVQAGRPVARRPSQVLAVLVLLQVALGVANVWLRLPMEVTLLHSAGAASIALASTWQLVRVWRAPVVQVLPAGRAVGAR